MTVTFTYTGSAQTWTVPAGVTQVTVKLYGAGGSDGGAEGGYVEATMAVTPGDTYQINVGGGGDNFTGNSNGGWNGGGAGGKAPGLPSGGAGGGASDIRRGAYGLSDRIVVAGGGGGGDQNGVGSGRAGYPTGESSAVPLNPPAATGGSASAGGTGAGATGFNSIQGNPGSFGVGGNAPTGGSSYGGGAGGGWYGGGSGGSGFSRTGGAGGSSYVDTSYATLVTAPTYGGGSAGGPSGSSSTGTHGQVVIEVPVFCHITHRCA